MQIFSFPANLNLKRLRTPLKFKARPLFLIFFLVIFLILYYYYYYIHSNYNYNHNGTKCTVNIAIILCNNDQKVGNFNRNVDTTTTTTSSSSASDFSRQINQTVVMLKSIVLLEYFSLNINGPTTSTSTSIKSQCINVIVLSDSISHFEKLISVIFNEQNWSIEFTRFLNFTFQPISYPLGSKWMKNLFRPCATLRLFLPELLTQDRVIYLDTDIIFFQSIHTLWNNFFLSNQTPNNTIAGMGPCLFHYGSGNNDIPYYGKSGLNAGIMLMDLKKMRSCGWTQKIKSITAMYQSRLRLADQDILNIYFHFYPEQLTLISCDWNFRAFNCRDGSYCEDRELLQGISALHGNALSFTKNGPEPLFRTVYETFERISMNKTHKLQSIDHLVEDLEFNLHETEEKTNSQCKKYGGFNLLLLNRLVEMVQKS